MRCTAAATCRIGATSSFSDLVHKANMITDQAERAQLYEQAQQVFHDQFRR